jgi:hypothetical protein
MDLSSIVDTMHVGQGVKATDGRYLDLPILSCQPNTTVPDVEYVYFLLHKLIGDTSFVSGARHHPPVIRRKSPLRHPS